MEDEWVTEGHYNVEMQVAQRPGLKRRSRYYHSQIDMDLLVSGTDYELLPDTYVIFLCDFDPFEEGRYRYSFEERCQESPLLYLEDGRHTVFLSTKGTNEEDEPEVLVKFLKFVGAGLEKSTEDFEDDYIERLQTSIRRIKADREMGERFMTFEELLKDERAKGKAEGSAFCGAQRTPMRFGADAMRSITDTPKRSILLFNFSAESLLCSASLPA